MSHVMQFNLDLVNPPTLGDDFADIDVVPRVVAAHPLSIVTDEVVALLQPLYNSNDATFDYAELWKFEDLTFDASYITTYNIGELGTSVDPTAPANQVIFTFRTFEGGVMKVVLQESHHNAGGSVNYANMAAADQALADYMTGDADCFFLARDTSYPFLVLRVHPGQSESTFKRRFR
jgi:hypothetical protein